MRKSILVILTVLLLFACDRNDRNRLDIDISNIDIEDFQIRTYGKDLFETDKSDFNNKITELAIEYPYFLPEIKDDSKNIKRLLNYVSDPFLISLNEQVQSLYHDKSVLTNELEQAFKHYKYYFPNKPLPNVYSYISGLEFGHPILLSEEALIIGLDLYLGPQYESYTRFGVPKYKQTRMQASFISVDCMKEFALVHNVRTNQLKSFLDEIIYQGKTLYFIDAMLPDKADHLKIGYSPEQYEWSLKNEANVWATFIENELLFSSDFERIRKFITDGPFTLSISREAPAALGVWIGWRIVSSYMENNPGISLTQLLQIDDSRIILKNSGYKPAK